jgi:hypothetical protein
MKLARFWPMAASLTAVGLMCVMLARADSKPPAPVPPAPPTPADVPPSPFEAIESPSDLPYSLNEQHCEATACATKACTNGACEIKPCPGEVCPTATECPSPKRPAAYYDPADWHVHAADGPVFSFPPGTSIASSWFCAPAGCETACEARTPCGQAAACMPAMTVAACEPGKGCACPKKCCCGDACACGDTSPRAGFAWGEIPAPGFGYPPHPALPAWGPTPPLPHMAPSFMHPMHEPPHPHLHPQLAEAMIENARLGARDEAWREMQRRQQETANIAVENAQLRAQLELATHKEKMFDKMAEVLVQNATLATRLEAVQERQELLEAVMEVATEKARLEAAVEAMETHLEAHVDMLNTLVEAKEELIAPLHEALVENAALKAAAEAQEETTALKARVADLERMLGKLSSGKTREAAPVVKTARKPESETESK